MKESYEWIAACITSSTNKFQFECCHKLIELFRLKFNEGEGTQEWTNILEIALYNQEIKHSIEV